MGLFRRKQDPIAESEKQLQSQMASVEREIRQLQQSLETDGASATSRAQSGSQGPRGTTDAPRPEAPTFETVAHRENRNPFDRERENTRAHYNELGVRKYDPLANLRRWWSQFRGEPARNPKLVSYLAAGSIHGLRPLRYEKRVARNRFLALCAFFIAILWGLIYFYLRNR